MTKGQRTMSEYKLVPVEPTPEMLEAGEYAQYTGCYVSGIYADMLAAAPAVQEEPTIDPYDAGSLNDFGGGDVGWWHGYIRAELDRAYEFYLMQLASAPQPAPQPAEQQPDIAQLVEALARCRHEASYSIGEVDALSIQLGKVRDIVNQTLSTLAPYRKQGGEV